MSIEQDPTLPPQRITRPTQVDRRAARRSADVQRYTVDLSAGQRRSLALFAANWDVDKSKIVRTLLYLLEADPALRARVQAELFADEQPAPQTPLSADSQE